MSVKIITKELEKLADKKKSGVISRFFKSGPGEYGEGDQFIGISVPNTRLVAKKHVDTSFNDIKELLKSPIHEYRLCALLILVAKFEKGDIKEKKLVYDIYVNNTRRINNWDLVDLSSYKIVGEYLIANPDKRKILCILARSKNLWEKRIAIVSTYAFIRKRQFEDTLKISEILLKDEHDLIHKAVGWMLRELGNRDRTTEEIFLKKYYRIMPRTMLRYAIEKFPEDKRQHYLNKSND